MGVGSEQPCTPDRDLIYESLNAAADLQPLLIQTFVVPVDPDIATTTHIGLPLISFDLLLTSGAWKLLLYIRVPYHLWLSTAPTLSYDITRPQTTLLIGTAFLQKATLNSDT